MASNNYYRRGEQPPAQPPPSVGVGRGMPSQSQSSFSGGNRVANSSTSGSVGGPRVSPELRRLMGEAKSYIKYLNERHKQIISEGNERKFAVEMEEIDWCLSVIQDVLSIEKYGEYVLKEAYDKAISIAYAHPIDQDLLNSPTNEGAEEVEASNTHTPRVEIPLPETPPPPRLSARVDWPPTFSSQYGPSSFTEPGRGRGAPWSGMNQPTPSDPRPSTFVSQSGGSYVNHDPRQYQGVAPQPTNYQFTPMGHEFGPGPSNYGSTHNFVPPPNSAPRQFNEDPHYVDRQRSMSSGYPGNASQPQQQHGNPYVYSGMPPANYNTYQHQRQPAGFPPRPPSNSNSLPGIPDFDHTSDYAFGFGDRPQQSFFVDSPQYRTPPLNQMPSRPPPTEQFHSSRRSPPVFVPDRIPRNPDAAFGLQSAWRRPSPSPNGHSNPTPSPPAAALTLQEVSKAKAQRCFTNTNNSNPRSAGPGRGGSHRNPYQNIFRPSSIPPKKPIKLNQPIHLQRQQPGPSSSSSAAPPSLPSNQIPAVPRGNKTTPKPNEDLNEKLERVKNSLASKLQPQPPKNKLKEMRKQSSLNNPNFIPLGPRLNRPNVQDEVEPDSQPEDVEAAPESSSSEESTYQPVVRKTFSKKANRSSPVARKGTTKKTVPKPKKSPTIKLKFPSKSKKNNEDQNSRVKRKNVDPDRSVENARKKQKVSSAKRHLISEDSEEDEVPERPASKNANRKKTPKYAKKSSSTEKSHKTPSVTGSESSVRSGPSEVSTFTSTSGSSDSGEAHTSNPTSRASESPFGNGNQAESNVMPDQHQDQKEFIVERAKRKKDRSAPLVYPPPPPVQETAPRIIGPRDMYVNSGLAKIKIEPDYMPPVAVKPEPAEGPVEPENSECPDPDLEPEDDLEKQMEDLFNEDETPSDSAHIVMEELDIPDDDGDLSEEEACPIRIRPIQSILENSMVDSDTDIDNMEDTPEVLDNSLNSVTVISVNNEELEDMNVDPDIEPVGDTPDVEAMEYSNVDPGIDVEPKPVRGKTIAVNLNEDTRELPTNVASREKIATKPDADVKNIQVTADDETVEDSTSNNEGKENDVENIRVSPSYAETMEESAADVVEKTVERPTEADDTIISIINEQSQLQKQNEVELKPEVDDDGDDEIQILDESEYTTARPKSFVLVDLDDENNDTNLERAHVNNDTTKFQEEDSFEQSEIIIQSVTTLRVEPNNVPSVPEKERVNIFSQKCNGTSTHTSSTPKNSTLEQQARAPPELDVSSRTNQMADPEAAHEDEEDYLITEAIVCASTIQAFKTGNCRPDKLDLLRVCYQDHWPCPFCEASFAIADVLSCHDHITRHTGELRVCCTRCLMRFPNEAEVKIHTEEAHADVLLKPVDKKLFKVLYTPEFPDNELHGFLCDTCGCFQMRRESMMKHLANTLHSKDNMYRIQFFPWEEGDHTRSNITTPGSSGFNTVSSKIDIDLGEGPDESVFKSAEMNKNIEARMITWLSGTRKYLQVAQDHDVWEHYDLLDEPSYEPPDQVLDKDRIDDADFPMSARNPLTVEAYIDEYQKIQKRIQSDEEMESEGDVEGDENEGSDEDVEVLE